jgi:hypothetical protein
MGKQLYLIHGNDETGVNDARYDLVTGLLSPEERDAGLQEVRGAGTTKLTLDRSYNEIISELGTSSFIPGAKRVVVIYDLKEFYDASTRPSKAKADPPKKKAAAVETIPRADALANWLRESLNGTENIAIFVCLESDEKGKSIAQDGPLYKLIREQGTIIEKREKPLQYELEDRILQGDLSGALHTLTEWVDRATDSSSRTKIFFTVGGVVELVFQAWCLDQAKATGKPAGPATVQVGYPTLGKLFGSKGTHVRAIARGLNEASIRELLDLSDSIQRALFPSGEENYVQDWQQLTELLILRLTTVKAAR